MMEDLSKEIALSEDLENWMTNLPPKLRTIPLIYLAIPGSHDSMTSSITTSSKLAPDAENFLQQMKFLGPLLRFIMARWSKTQDYDMLEQLKAGIRYFDLRVATKKGSVYPYFVHGLYATEVVSVLNDLKKFLDSHPGEVVILDFNHFYALEKIDHNNFLRLLNATFNQKLTPYSHNMQHLTLEYFSKFRYQVIIVYRSDMARFQQPNLWPSASFPSPWPQTVSKRELITKLDEGIAGRPNNTSFISQFVLTPTNWFVTKHLFSTLRKQCAKPLTKVIQNWIQKQKVGVGGVNIIICDFIDINDYEFTKEIVSLNAKALFNEFMYNAPSLTPVDK
ncbi:hypothetical protein ILUMI_22850 [Ignelater luminosus]|uniref:Phosphatidylinositol-specific phospholipase C X domain-containing protein n=1 Tax=Ignelater luminosus TaxID=2038154 RepID=A0A8K0G2I2_IGNLU|nr:hypothetical protein ILUMI_22850 [Ignelater luminosus]